MAAPIASQVLGEVLPYLELNKDSESEEDKRKEVTIPNIIGMNVEEAEKVLKEEGLGIKINTEKDVNKKEEVVKKQLPQKGIKVYEGTNIFVTI